MAAAVRAEREPRSARQDEGRLPRTVLLAYRARRATPSQGTVATAIFLEEAACKDIVIRTVTPSQFVERRRTVAANGGSLARRAQIHGSDHDAVGFNPQRIHTPARGSLLPTPVQVD